jgi:hypothetical protein
LKVTDVADDVQPRDLACGIAVGAIDWNQFLPSGYTDAQMDAIDPVTGIIARAAKGPKGVFEPAVWIPAE